MDLTEMTLREGLLHKRRRPWSIEEIAEVWRRHFERLDTDPEYRARYVKNDDPGPSEP